VAGKRRDSGGKLRDLVALDLQCPGRVDRRLGARLRQVQHQVGHVEGRAVLAKGQARREQKPAHDAVLIDAAEVAELDDDDLGLLVGANPDVVAAIDPDPVRRVDAGDEDRCLPGGAIAVHRNLNDLMKRGVGHEQDRAVAIELDAVRPELTKAVARRGDSWNAGLSRMRHLCDSIDQRCLREPVSRRI